MTTYVKFNGTSDYATVSHHADYNLTSNYEISCTFKPFDFVSTSDYLINKNVYGIIFNPSGNQSVEFATSLVNKTNIRDASRILIPDTGIHTVKYAYDGTTLRGYLDDVLKTESVIAATLLTNTTNITFGAGTPTSSYSKCNYYHFYIKSGGVLQGEWALEEGSGTTSADSSGKGHTMTLNSSSVWVTESAIVHQGSADLSSSGQLTASGKKVLQGSIGLSSNSTLLSASLDRVAVLHQASVSLSSSSNLSVDATVEATTQEVTGSASLSSSGQMDVSVTKLVKAEISLSSTSSLSAELSRDPLQGEVHASSDSELSAGGSVILQASAFLSSEGNITILNVNPISVDVELIGMRKLEQSLLGNRKLWETMRGGLPVINGQNFSVIAGTSLNISITLTEQDGTPLNLEGVTVMKWGFGSVEKGVRKDTTTSGIMITDAQEGMLMIQLKPEDTEGRHENTAHELEITDTFGNVSAVMRGMIYIEKEIL